jgi:mono/diheme cytochrome c family protein
MRYFFLIYALVALLVVGIMGLRGQKFQKPPIRVFPDMDEQDKLKAQKPDPFFADGLGSRPLAAGTQPRGFNPEGLRSIGGVHQPEFGGGTGYYLTGHIGDYYGSGMPEELALTPENTGALVRRGKERYGIYCAVCHGASGDGNGITNAYGVPVAANPNAKLNAISPQTYPDGRIFEVITKGKGQMGAYGHSIPVRDRWAIIAYLRVLQDAKASVSR